MEKQQVQPFMQAIFREALRDDVLVALDATEQALRTAENHNPTETGMELSEYNEALQLIASCYERLCVARQILDAAKEEAR